MVEYRGVASGSILGTCECRPVTGVGPALGAWAAVGTQAVSKHLCGFRALPQACTWHWRLVTGTEASGLQGLAASMWSCADPWRESESYVGLTCWCACVWLPGLAMGQAGALLSCSSSSQSWLLVRILGSSRRLGEGIGRDMGPVDCEYEKTYGWESQWWSLQGVHSGCTGYWFCQLWRLPGSCLEPSAGVHSEVLRDEDARSAVSTKPVVVLRGEGFWDLLQIRPLGTVLLLLHGWSPGPSSLSEPSLYRSALLVSGGVKLQQILCAVPWKAGKAGCSPASLFLVRRTLSHGEVPSLLALSNAGLGMGW